MARARYVSLPGLLLACTIAGSLHAQYVTGALEGRLVDAQGAALGQADPLEGVLDYGNQTVDLGTFDIHLF